MMMNPEGSTRSAARVVGGIVFLFSIVALYFQVTEPFVGSRMAYAGRILGPCTVMVIALSLLRQRREPTLWFAALAVLSVMTLVLVLAGRGS